ncbi:MAG: hypothetical protein ACK528_07195 [Alphaproteobacteria bacterium]
MAYLLAVVRSARVCVWMTVTVIPWATAGLIFSIFVRGDRLYWACVGWLRTAIWGAKVICGVRYRVLGWDNLENADKKSAIV